VSGWAMPAAPSSPCMSLASYSGYLDLPPFLPLVFFSIQEASTVLYFVSLIRAWLCERNADALRCGACARPPSCVVTQHIAGGAAWARSGAVAAPKYATCRLQSGGPGGGRAMLWRPTRCCWCDGVVSWE